MKFCLILISISTWLVQSKATFDIKREHCCTRVTAETLKNPFVTGTRSNSADCRGTGASTNPLACRLWLTVARSNRRPSGDPGLTGNLGGREAVGVQEIINQDCSGEGFVSLNCVQQSLCQLSFLHFVYTFSKRLISNILFQIYLLFYWFSQIR